MCCCADIAVDVTKGLRFVAVREAATTIPTMAARQINMTSHTSTVQPCDDTKRPMETGAAATARNALAKTVPTMTTS